MEPREPGPPRLVYWDDEAAHAGAYRALQQIDEAHGWGLEDEDMAAGIAVIVGEMERALGRALIAALRQREGG